MTKRILIIDDEPDIRETTQMCLEIAGEWEVLTAVSGKEGLVKATTEKPDVILLDVMMPDMDGLTTLQNLQKNPKTQNIPVVLLTAKAQAAEQRQFRPFQLIKYPALAFRLKGGTLTNPWVYPKYI
ncbi:two-component response regulator (plasmid) [Fischerella sp. NIES-4106]|nr:two-component response regulator [Fischerella sp. NIES-4106]